MTENNDLPPIIRVESKSGIAYYPRFHKNTKDEWELNDKSFQKILKPHMVKEKPIKKTDNG